MILYPAIARVGCGKDAEGILKLIKHLELVGSLLLTRNRSSNRPRPRTRNQSNRRNGGVDVKYLFASLALPHSLTRELAALTVSGQTD
jgi:hypothetical protein